jgi:ATP/maltotriose-dependent transcriptional regulator MalT
VVPVLHGRASAWFEREGVLEKAIEHATAAKDHERAGQLIARHWFGYVTTGQTATVRRWLDALPEDFVARTAPLTSMEAWICALQGARKKTKRFLMLAEDCRYQGNLPDGTPSVEAGVTLVRGFFGYGGVGEWVEEAERATRMESGRDSLRTALARIGLGMGQYCSGDVEGARILLEEGLGLTASNQPVLRVAMLSFLSFAVLDEGRLNGAGVRAILGLYPDAGVFPDLLERQERKLRKFRPNRAGSMDGQLTERELEVLRLLHTELSVSELGKQLYVAPSTVKSHVKSVYRKLGVSSRKEAVEQAYARRLI